MRIKFLFFTLVGLLLSMMVIIFFIDNKILFSWKFYIIEILLIIILSFLVFFYKKIVKPLNSISNGIELLKEQDFSSRLSKVGQYESDRIVEIFNRMMDQLKNEKIRIKEQNAFLKLVIDASPLGVVITDFNGNISSANPTAEKFFNRNGNETIIGKKLPEIDSSLTQILGKTEEYGVKTIQLTNADIYKCTYTYFLDKGFKHPFYLIESLTREVMSAEKEAYGKVIRMISHEVNNTTAGITSTLDSVNSILVDYKNTEDIRKVMQVCIDRCYSMSKFITKFADLVKIPQPVLKKESLNNLFYRCKQFLENISLERNIKINLSETENEIFARIDSSMFEQAIVNILKNSIESIGNNGNIYIKIEDRPVSIEIADDGKGIDKETETKLFSPFFSTKSDGQGIGLIFIREVLAKHNCSFSLRTYEDGITRFKIKF